MEETRPERTKIDPDSVWPYGADGSDPETMRGKAEWIRSEQVLPSLDEAIHRALNLLMYALKATSIGNRIVVINEKGVIVGSVMPARNVKPKLS